MDPKSITVDIAGPGTRYVEAQPGNGTRYRLLLTSLTDEQCKAIGCQLGSVMASLGVDHHYTSYPFASTGFLAQRYVAEKLSMSLGDIKPVTKLLSYLLNRPTD
jgi:hypothetical protein